MPIPLTTFTVHVLFFFLFRCFTLFSFCVFVVLDFAFVLPSPVYLLPFVFVQILVLHTFVAFLVWIPVLHCVALFVVFRFIGPYRSTFVLPPRSRFYRSDLRLVVFCDSGVYLSPRFAFYVRFTFSVARSTTFHLPPCHFSTVYVHSYRFTLICSLFVCVCVYTFHVDRFAAFFTFWFRLPAFCVVRLRCVDFDLLRFVVPFSATFVPTAFPFFFWFFYVSDLWYVRSFVLDRATFLVLSFVSPPVTFWSSFAVVFALRFCVARYYLPSFVPFRTRLRFLVLILRSFVLRYVPFTFYAVFFFSLRLRPFVVLRSLVHRPFAFSFVPSCLFSFCSLRYLHTFDFTVRSFVRLLFVVFFAFFPVTIVVLDSSVVTVYDLPVIGVRFSVLRSPTSIFLASTFYRSCLRYGLDSRCSWFRLRSLFVFRSFSFVRCYRLRCCSVSTVTFRDLFLTWAFVLPFAFPCVVHAFWFPIAFFCSLFDLVVTFAICRLRSFTFVCIVICVCVCYVPQLPFCVLVCVDSLFIRRSHVRFALSSRFTSFCSLFVRYVRFGTLVRSSVLFAYRFVFVYVCWFSFAIFGGLVVVLGSVPGSRSVDFGVRFFLRSVSPLDFTLARSLLSFASCVLVFCFQSFCVRFGRSLLDLRSFCGLHVLSPDLVRVLHTFSFWFASFTFAFAFWVCVFYGSVLLPYSGLVGSGLRLFSGFLDLFLPIPQDRTARTPLSLYQIHFSHYTHLHAHNNG